MGALVIKIHSIAFWMAEHKIPILPTLINKLFIRLLFGCQLGTRTRLGKNVMLGYGGLGVVIHERSIIEDNVSIGTGVTIGGTTKKYDVPVIGKNTLISTGAKILGPIRIGKNCVIGANAVVLQNIEDNCVAVGAPAKVVKRGICINDYR